jgi:hypothetical protein
VEIGVVAQLERVDETSAGDGDLLEQLGDGLVVDAVPFARGVVWMSRLVRLVP